MNMRLGVFLMMMLETQLSSTEAMKSCILLRTYRKIPNVLMCVYRPIECFDEMCLIYFHIFCVN